MRSGIGGTPTRRILPAMGVFLLLVGPGCGGGEEETGESPDAARGAADTGAATLTVGDDVYEFDRVRCAFGPGETGRDDTEFVLSAIQDGLQLDATVNSDFGHVVSLDDIEDFENPTVGWSAGGPVAVAGGGAGQIIEVDGKRVSVEATFTNRISGETAAGSLSAVCP